MSQLLVASGADPNVADVYGSTPLHIAAFKGNKEMAQVLIASDANPNVADRMGITPLHLAAKNDEVRAPKKNCEEVANGADINTADEDGNTPFLNAALSGHIEVAQLLIGSGADVDYANNSGQTPSQLLHQLQL